MKKFIFTSIVILIGLWLFVSCTSSNKGAVNQDDDNASDSIDQEPNEPDTTDKEPAEGEQTDEVDPNAKKYTVSFDTDGGTMTPSYIVTEGQLVPRPTDPTKDGYTFVKWCKTSSYSSTFSFETTKITKDMTVYAYFVIASFKVKFETNGGTAINDFVGEYDSLVEKPSNPTKEYYSFDGWYKDSEYKNSFDFSKDKIPGSDMTIYAKWNNLKYYVTYESIGIYNMTKGEVNQPGGYIEKPSDPVLTGYTFGGFFNNYECTTSFDFSKEITKDTTVFLKWTPVVKKVSFVTNCEIELEDESVDYNDNVIVPEEPIKENFDFVCWCSDEALTEIYSFDDVVKSDMKLYAKWIEHTDTTSTYGTVIDNNLSALGSIEGLTSDFSKYLGTSAYRVVNTPEELFKAINDAKMDYTNIWDKYDETLVQRLNSVGSVHVIEINSDLNLGYNVLTSAAKSYSNIVKSWVDKPQFVMSSMVKQNGISQINISQINDLLIYSKNGSKLIHGGFKITSCSNIAIRNLKFDEMWEWEDTSDIKRDKIGDYDTFGWAYFKVRASEGVWFDHCSFGKSFDGQIDYSLAAYQTNIKGEYIVAPYNPTGYSGMHISWCDFHAGSDDENGYLYKMMQEIEANYQVGGKTYLYYNALRKTLSFEQILYGIAIPQKKAFLLCDTGDSEAVNYPGNYSFANCVFTNIEDRLPNCRSGNAYFYNSIIDNTTYYNYRKQIKAVGFSFPNGSWKNALVSQTIIACRNAAIKFENVKIIGADNLDKNNQDGYYTMQYVNVSYQKDPLDSSTIINNIIDTDTKVTTPILKWHTGKDMYEITPIDLDELDATLSNTNYGVGTKLGFDFQYSFLKTIY